MSERVALLAFDAMDPGIVRRMAADGKLPAFAALLQSASRRPIETPVGLFVGALWPTLFTGRSAAQTGFHCWEEIVPASYERRLTTAASIRGTPFWRELSDAGKRVAVLDVPHSRAGEPLNGVQVSEWGCHDRHFGLRSYPSELARRIADRHGFHPVLGQDPWSVREWAPDDYVFRDGPLRTGEEEEQLLEGLLAGARTKAQLSCEILEQERWDLFVSVFGETHSVGHQSWHVHDPEHPRHDSQLRARIGDPLERVYEAMDQALADHLRALGEDVALMVLLSHGIGPHNDATHLLPETLRLLDASYSGRRQASWRRRLLASGWDAAPPVVRERLGPQLARRLRRRPAGTATDHESAEARRAQRFFMSPNNFVVGGIRINLRGREHDGKVSPGGEFDRLCERLRDNLLALVNLDTGAPVVREVSRTDEHYDRSPDDTLPDLFVTWNHDAPIETIWSPRFGVIHGPYVHWRTGDHRPGGLLLTRDPAGNGAEELAPLATEALAAVIAQRLGQR